ncbi:heavy metal translocatin [Fistulina hepatica ATCC 64428]|uniref:P-type Cu(+) transporter n=1 Tax=Fistulina hepatica ATCC 64428 TaxID=1128425 RepID=A0A0D7AJV7_9AGAR|nr:heavy metal translocatin [Fistulina hepatica ATCC 64428]
MPALLNNIWPSPSPAAIELTMSSDEDEPLLSKQSLALDQQPTVERCELRIEGMTCGSCVEAIEGVLRQQPGVLSIKVALLSERGVVEYDPAQWSVEKLVEEISDIGFDATHIPPTRADRVTLRVYGMTCSSCTSTVEAGVSALPGVNSASVSLATETCTVDFDRSLVGPREMVEAIEDMGFDAILSDQEDTTQLQSLTRAKEIAEWRSRCLWALAFAVPVTFFSMIAPQLPWFKPILDHRMCRGIYTGDFVLFLLTTPVQFWIGFRFYRSAYKAVRHGTLTMDVLVVTGTSASYFYSVFVIIGAMFATGEGTRPVVFFDTSTMLIFFVSVGRYLENRAKGRTSAALTDLMALAPSMATIYTDAESTQEKRIATELVQVGDTVKIVPGDKIPADGTVLRGASSVDESALTGEAVPVFKHPGDSVIGGTVNGLGTFDMIVTRAGKDTALKQIVRLVEEAQTSKAPVQAFADRVAGYFVPSVLSLAALTFLTWMILSTVLDEDSLPPMFHNIGVTQLSVCLQICVSVIVVACPCALGLSTPTAIMVGTGMGAQNGILIKGGRALEASKDIKRVVLDKTGTVTVGKLEVVGMCWSDSGVYGGDTSLTGLCDDGVTTKRSILVMVSATEAKSEHPLARAVASFGRQLLQDTPAFQHAQVESFESVTGAGVKATVTHSGKTHSLLIGSAHFVTSDSGHLPASLLDYEAGETALGRTVIFVASHRGKSEEAVPLLAFSLRDTPKPSSARAIQSLQDMGIEVYMMTGDSKATADAIAREVGIPRESVWAGMSPQGKAQTITELIAKHGNGVAMVGDGINDSPALVAASVGIALSSGTSVAIEAADIVLVRSDLLDVVAALHLSRRIFSVIRRNLWWACIYNLLGIPIAMGLLLPFGIYMHPMTAGAAMAFSSVSVVTSSLTLRWWRRPKESLMPDDDLPEANRSIFGVLVKITRSTASEVWQTVVLCRRRDGVRYTQLPIELATSRTGDSLPV